MTEEETEDKTTRCNPGRLIIQYLEENKGGATLNEILQYLRNYHSKEPSNDLSQTVETILESGTNFGFLEKKGSRFMNWVAREMCGRRRRSRCRRRKRRIRRRCSRRRRRPRRCRC